MTSLELKILKLAQGWAKLKPHDYYSHHLHAEGLNAAGIARRNIGRKLLKLFPASLKG